ncbi:unnamed protein product [Cuscuta campestris]|uniref:Uncharacterized protein n=1 Tax=Cuscuta campestris TaxID=132261 RepID=A0A484KW89_9ASTE|nr:unnamed protein product [Cuscuta campestris]
MGACARFTTRTGTRMYPEPEETEGQSCPDIRVKTIGISEIRTQREELEQAGHGAARSGGCPGMKFSQRVEKSELVNAQEHDNFFKNWLSNS